MPDLITINVALMSGRSVQIEAMVELLLKDVKLQAQNSLLTNLGVLRNSAGQVLDEAQTVDEAGLRSGDVLTLQVRQTLLASNKDGEGLCRRTGGWIRGHLGSSL